MVAAVIGLTVIGGGLAAYKTQELGVPFWQGERVEEIARMLGGVKITQTTRKHAAEMLDSLGEKA